MRKSGWKRILAAVIAVVTALCLLSGCSIFSNLLKPSFDPVAYVQGNLDTTYLGIVTDEYLNTISDSREDCLAGYETGLHTEAAFFAEYFDVRLDLLPAEYEDKIVDLYRDIYAYSNYTVGESSERDDGFVVDVTVYPIDIMQKIMDEDAEGFMEQWNARLNAGEFDSMTEEEFEAAWADSIIAMVEARIPSIGYLDPVTILVQVEHQEDSDGNGYYTLNDEDFQELDIAMIQY